MTNRPETSTTLENQRVKSPLEAAYELRRAGDEGFSLYHRPLLTQGVACLEQHPNHAAYDPSDFVHAATVDEDQWGIIAGWLGREMSEGGHSDSAARLWCKWDALPLDRGLGLRLHQLMEMAVRIWAMPMRCVDDVDEWASRTEFLLDTTSNWYQHRGWWLDDPSQLKTPAWIIQNSAAGYRSLQSSISSGTLVIHLPQAVLAEFRRYVSRLPADSRGDNDSRWLSAWSQAGSALMLFDQRREPATYFGGARAWGIGPILTSAPICTEYGNDRTPAEQMEAIRHLWAAIEPLLDSRDPNWPPITAHERLEFRGTLDTIESTYVMLTNRGDDLKG
ncbi:MAG TPA: hypothetical protein VM639_23575 [Dongiaceae bacterium]|nr:hypothetical protein [Dongiaceae bacterium]